MLLLILLFACQANGNELFFMGENEYWSATMTVNQSNGDETYQLEMNYKGSDLQDIGDFHYSVETKNNKVIDFKENNISLNKQGKYQKTLPISNSPATNKNDEFVITVEWNGNSTDFTLKNK